MRSVQIGTSGYYFKDWIGPFYPPGTKPEGMLAYYATQFKVVEINMTYYGVPKAKTFAGMADQVPEDFGFYIKVHQDVTHKRENPKPSLLALRQATQPLRERGMLRGFLAQFPYSFKKNPETREYIVQLADWFAGSIEPLFVEFRHTSWCRAIVYESLARHNLGFVNVDLPLLPHLPPPSAVITNDTGYVRFHGRNSAAWWGKSGEQRYNYDYPSSELQEWLPRIAELRQNSRRAVIFMNNCFLGQAARNAKMLEDLFTEL